MAKIIQLGSIFMEAPDTAQALSFAAITYSNQRLPDDPIGNTVLSFTGVPDDTEVRIYRVSNNEELAGVENFAENDTLTIPYFGSGASDIRMVFLNLQYEYLSIDLETPARDSLIPVVMRVDRNYEND